MTAREDLRRLLRERQTPLYYVNTSMFNLLGLEPWLARLKFINTVDSFEGNHPDVFVPPGARSPMGIEAATEYLLTHPAVARQVRQSSPAGEVLFLMFSEETERLARDLGLRVCFPPAHLRQRLDSKVMTTQLGDRAGVPSVPNILTQVDSYDGLRRVAGALGTELVIQLPYGDSGRTTFFVSSEADFRPHAAEIVAHPAVKVMKRIRCRQATIEGCVTRHGVLVGPLCTELVGFEELTPHRGGWCGNELLAAGEETFLSPEIHRQAQRATIALGEQLVREGYWGYFGLDFLVDEETGALYLGELNPRLTGATPMTTQAALQEGEAPLFVFHMLESAGAEYELDVEHYNQRWLAGGPAMGWSQMVIGQVDDSPGKIVQAPASGLWRMEPNGAIHFAHPAFGIESVTSDAEAFFLRTVDPGHALPHGYSLGRLLTRGRLMTEDGRLNERARHWIQGLRASFRTA